MTYLGDPFWRSIAASVALHLSLLLLFAWPKPRVNSPPQIPIHVTLLPVPERMAPPVPAPPPPQKRSAVPRVAPTRPSKSKAIIAQKNSPILDDRPVSPTVPDPQPAPRFQPRPPPREAPEDRFAISERRLPTLKDLLPPLDWSTGQRRGDRDGPVRLNTRDPQYITYFSSIKRAIETVWQYPELALRYGLQGKLLLEFSIQGNGELAGARIIRSSGSNVLDDEALRAVRSAAPFGPIPPWIGKDALDILASFEYYDSRLNYRYMP